eukprot:snap_masked-scaffold_56-processed-gene-1.21-mRNA-1 protein AED:1.00 eAED:1.00 QI:0/-1/0/0/-1/1/1/0/86
MIKHFRIVDSGISSADCVSRCNIPSKLFEKSLKKKNNAKEGVNSGEAINIKEILASGNKCLEPGVRFNLKRDYPIEGEVVLNELSF